MTRLARSPIAVFLGPSLGQDEARALLDADYYPPARKGDVYRILPSGVKTIILIDGVFHATPAVWQRELVDAMEEGIQVLGASSMGALRAAELHGFGMIGHGTIYQWYRDGVIDGDDEVALWHAPEEFAFRPLSEPLVNIRCTLLRAVDDQCLTQEHARELTAYARQMYYPKRSYDRLLNSPVVRDWPQDQAAMLARYVSTNSIDLKGLDAIGVLRYCADNDSLTREARNPRGVTRSISADRSRSWNDQRLMMSGFFSSHGVVTGEQVLNEARGDSGVTTMRPILTTRYFVVEWAKQNGVSCPIDVLTSFITEWEAHHGIFDRPAWLRANGLTQPIYETLLAERALIHWVTTRGPAHFGLDRGFVLDWARQNGVALPPGSEGASIETDETALEDWIVEKGPNHFGRRWQCELALMREWQITGRAADLIEEMAARDRHPS